MPYHVQRGDTIAKVTQLLDMKWETLRRINPKAVGQSSKTGNWFLKEGAEIKGKETFESVLRQEQATDPQIETAGVSKDSEPFIEYTIQPGDTLWALAVKRFRVNVEDLIRENGIRDPDKIRPGQKIRVRTVSLPERQEEVVASWYGDRYHGRPMANGEFFNMYGNTMAHKSLPFGTRVELRNPETGQRAEAVVTDRGPYVARRDVDISYGLARRLSLVEKG
ncbi:MAG: LysM peptidoglycan-binding domain-containing protein, partial [Deltaproteobacteria bacterium]|nr:LysM peptidoglycan-binding domain-containing protein [Deltaproteobacteria bacterium]